jgi:hypothetical protein
MREIDVLHQGTPKAICCFAIDDVIVDPGPESSHRTLLEGLDGFVPVEIAREPAAAAALPGSARTGDRAIEIRLPNGIVIGVSDAIAVEPLRRVLAALSGR